MPDFIDYLATLPPPLPYATSFPLDDGQFLWLWEHFRDGRSETLASAWRHRLDVLHWATMPQRPLPGEDLPPKMLPTLLLCVPTGRLLRCYGWPTVENWKALVAACGPGRLAAGPLLVHATPGRRPGYLLPVWTFELRPCLAD